MITIAATADIHSPRGLALFNKALDEARFIPDIFIIAGDIVDKNKIEYAAPVLHRIKKKYPDIPVIAVFGNEEYRGYEDKYRERYPDITWLDDEYIVVEARGEKIGIIGTRGALEKPTTWQARNMPWIAEYYKNLPDKIENLLEIMEKKKPTIKILVSHYGVATETLVGEPRRIWPYLGDPRISRLFAGRLHVMIHGHAHNAKKTKTIINTTTIYNVSLPANRSIVEITIAPEESEGLLRWLKQ